MVEKRVDVIRKIQLIIEELIQTAAASRSQRLLCKIEIYCEALNGTGILSALDWVTITQALDKLRQDATEW